jgi:hypothetical protein
MIKVLDREKREDGSQFPTDYTQNMGSKASGSGNVEELPPPISEEEGDLPF